MKVMNVMMVIDILQSEVSTATKNFLLNFFITYRDQSLNEHLINISDAVDEVTSDEPEFLQNNEYTNTIVKEVIELNKLAAENDAAYVRLIEQ